MLFPLSDAKRSLPSITTKVPHRGAGDLDEKSENMKGAV